MCVQRARGQDGRDARRCRRRCVGSRLVDDRGGVARCSLDQTLTARGQVVGHPRGVQRQRIHVDDVDVGLLPDLDDTAIGEPEQLRGVVEPCRAANSSGSLSPRWRSRAQCVSRNVG